LRWVLSLREGENGGGGFGEDGAEKRTHCRKQERVRITEGEKELTSTVKGGRGVFLKKDIVVENAEYLFKKRTPRHQGKAFKKKSQGK